MSGVARVEDAVEAVHLGVHALGFRLGRDDARSPDSDTLHRILDRLPPWVARVGVLDAGEATRIVASLPLGGLDALELRDPADPVALKGLPLRSYPSLELGPGFDPRGVIAWAPGPVLLRATPDTDAAAELVGLWSVAQTAGSYLPVLLGGPLDASNLEPALRAVRPYGVDLGPALWREPDRLDLDRLEAALDTMRRVGVEA